MRTLAEYRVRARVNAATVTAACAAALRCDRSYEFYGMLTAPVGADDAADLRRRIEASRREIGRSLLPLAGAYRAGHPAERRRVVADLRALPWDRFETIRPIDPTDPS